MITSTWILRLLVISALTVCACAKEYVLEDLIAMETSNVQASRRSSVQQHVNATVTISAKRHDGRAQKSTRQVEEVRSNLAENNGTSSSSGKDEDDEDKKTLAQQVADGKYGLIQKELFEKSPERPGIISYEVNPEVPKDNVNNLGGLKPEEIWLAENHLLVLAGGGRYNDDNRGASWAPIDDYKAPPRQVKIPPNPKVPPPFPIQLRPGGPVEFIRGANGSGGPPPFPFFPPPGNDTGGVPTPFFVPPINMFQGNFTPGNGQAPFPFPPPFPPPAGFRNGSFPPPPFGPFPPGANFLPPPANITGPLDEDDPSIYYPPPYDFVYKRDNTSLVPPGPLVPGIVLPPPPDFFAPLGERSKPKPAKKRPQQPTTKRPAVKIVTDDPSINEITPTSLPHEIPPNADVQGWVPIPAPRPFYITGARKPILKNTRLNPDGYKYQRPEDVYQIPNDEPNKWVVNKDNPLFRPTTTVTPVPYVPKGKAIKDFYFYDEPRQEVTTIAPPYYSTATPQRHQFYELKNRPVHYFYITKPPPTVETSTNRPPVYEYSYTAPGYGTLETPRLSVVTTTAPPPIHQYVNYDYELQPPSSNSPLLHHVSTASPIGLDSTTPRPLHGSTTQQPYSIQTENPYHAFFTHHDYSLIDDITKKYFTIFGQKINGDGPTTPLPNLVQTRRPTSQPNRVKFPTEPPIKHTTPYPPSYWSTARPTYSSYPEYDDYYYDRPNYKYQAVQDYYDIGQRQHPQISYEGDTRVNTVRPYPSRNPLAEDFAGQKGNGHLLLQSVYKTQSAPIQQQIRANYSRPLQYLQGGNFNYALPSYGNEEIDLETRDGFLRNLYNKVFGQTERPPSLAEDTKVNEQYINQNATPDPDAEVFDPQSLKPRDHIRIQNLLNHPSANGDLLVRSHGRPSLHGDTKVNDQYRDRNVTPDPNAEVFDPLKPRDYVRVQNFLNQNAVNLPVRSQALIGGQYRPPSLHDDTKVNDQYRDQNVTPDPDVETFDPQSLKPRDYVRVQNFLNQNAVNLPVRSQGLVGNRYPPPSLHDDTNVNDRYRDRNVTPDPNAEVFDPQSLKPRDHSALQSLLRHRPTNGQIPVRIQTLSAQRPPSLVDDTKVNDRYRDQNVTPDPDAEVFDPNSFKPRKPVSYQGYVDQKEQSELSDALRQVQEFTGDGRGQPGVIAYNLPGNGGGHFYFLTPQSVPQDASYQIPDQIQNNLLRRRNVRRRQSNRQDKVERQNDDKTKQGATNGGERVVNSRN